MSDPILTYDQENKEVRLNLIKFIEDKEEAVVTLVTTMDIDPKNMLISIESNLGKALTGKKAGDIVEVNAPMEKYTVEIIEIL